jgi:hypothetical protein
MRRLRAIPSLCLAVVLAAAGCGTTTTPSVSTPVPTGSAPPATPAATPSPEPTVTPAPTESLTEVFPSGAFNDSTTVDNPWFPLTPGARLTFKGATNGDEGERIPHRVEFTVTDMTKVIDGVRTVVGYELDFSDGELVEAEIALWAQDDEGTVWHLGQYPEEYEEGKIVATPAWIAGVQDAKAGISMKAEPQFGSLSYSQGWGPAVDWTDRARVFDIGTSTCVPAGCYEDVLVIDEFNRDEPDAHQLKYYAPGIGNVRVGWAGALEKDQEVLELVEVTKLSTQELTKLRQTILAMEKRAYELSKDVYGTTTPAEPAG